MTRLIVTLFYCSIVTITYLLAASSINAQVPSGVPIGPTYDAPLRDLGIQALGRLVGTLLSNAHIVAGVLLLIFILLGGFGMLASAGSSDAQKAAQAKAAVTWATLGFLIIFASYWIIQLVQLITGVQIL